MDEKIRVHAHPLLRDIASQDTRGLLGPDPQGNTAARMTEDGWAFEGALNINDRWAGVLPQTVG